MDELIEQIDNIIAMHENDEPAGVRLYLNKLREDAVSMADAVENIQEQLGKLLF